MDYLAILAESWRIARREPGLWPLGMIRALLSLVSSLFLFAVGVPAVIAVFAASPAPLPANVQTVQFLASDVLRAWLPAWTVLTALLGLMWLAAATLDVAAVGGLITQVDASASGQKASAQTGLADGFRHWLRIAGLMALTAMPVLVVLLVRVIVLWLAVALPQLRGGVPDPNVVLTSWYALSPLGLLASALAIPLGVLVELALRFAVAEDLEWKAAFARAWSLARGALGKVVAVYLALLVAVYMATLVAGVAASLVVGALLAGAVGVAATGDTSGAVWLGMFGVAALCATMFVATTLIAPFTSGVWTLLWRATTGRDGRFTPSAVPGDAREGSSQ